MEDQASELRKLMSKQKILQENEEKETQEIQNIEELIEESDNEIRNILIRILKAHEHRKTQMEELAQVKIRSDFSQLSAEKKRNVLLHKELAKYLKKLEQQNKESAHFTKKIIEGLQDIN